MSHERWQGNEQPVDPFRHPERHQVEIDGYAFTLVASDREIDGVHPPTHYAQVVCNAEDCVADGAQERFFQALTKAAELAKRYDEVHVWAEYIGSGRAPQLSWDKWDLGFLLESAEMVDAAVAWSDEYGFPLTPELRSKLTRWVQKAMARASLDEDAYEEFDEDEDDSWKDEADEDDGGLFGR